MENKNEMISDLKTLVSVVNDGKEGYDSAAENTKSVELTALFLKHAAERKAFEKELKAHIAKHGGESDNESGGILGALHRGWMDIKEALSSNTDAAVLGAVETGEKAALEKYDELLKKTHIHADHLDLLSRQRDSIQKALTGIQSRLAAIA